MFLVAMFSSFTSGGGIGGNKEIGDPPPPWVGCLFIYFDHRGCGDCRYYLSREAIADRFA
jgi:hypothetical protein